MEKVSGFVYIWRDRKHKRYYTFARVVIAFVSQSLYAVQTDPSTTSRA